MTKYILTLISAVLLMLSCNPDSKSTTNSTSSKGTKTTETADHMAVQKEKLPKASDEPGIIIKSSSGRDMTHKRAEALDILNYRIQEDGEIYQIIEKGLFEYDFVHDGKKMSKLGEHEGQWIDFMEDNKYTYGKNKKTLGSGKYHYEMHSEKLLMVDDDEKVNPQEFTIKRKAHVMIKVGTEVYGNNNLQMKLVQRDNLDQVVDPDFQN